MKIERCDRLDHAGWLALREALWPYARRDEHLAEMAQFVAQPRRYVQFLASDGGEAIGLIEVSLRTDYVNGCDSSPVAFLEGLYVAPSWRRRGIARRLVSTAEAWARERGCGEIASDTPLGNTVSQAVHRALGFEETERVVFFRRHL